MFIDSDSKTQLVEVVEGGHRGDSAQKFVALSRERRPGLEAEANCELTLPIREKEAQCRILLLGIVRCFENR